MKSVRRFIIFWRYLLLACLVLVCAGDYLFVGLPHATVPSAPQPSSLRGKYDKIEQGMTESQVMEILGPPQWKEESTVMDCKQMTWYEGQDGIYIFFMWGETGIVMTKRFITRSGQTVAQGER
jgi:hypothetical protein